MLTKALEELKQLELELFALGHAMGSLSYDGVTCAPKTSAVPSAASTSSSAPTSSPPKPSFTTSFRGIASASDNLSDSRRSS